MQHERVRFRKADIAALETLPSACVPPPLAKRRAGRGRGVLKAFLYSILGIVALMVVAAAGLYLAGAAGFGNERIKREAEIALSAYAGVPVRVEAGTARLSWGQLGLVSIEVPSVRLLIAEDGREFARAGAMRFGFSLRPLLSGRLSVAEVALKEAVIDGAALPKSDEPGWLDGVADARGLVDPDKVVASIFGGMNQLFDALEGRQAPRVVLRDVELLFAGPGRSSVHADHVSAWRERGQGLKLEGTFDLLGRPVTMTGSASRRSAAGLKFDLQIDVQRLAADTEGASAPSIDGSGRIRLTGSRPAPGRGRIRIAATGSEIIATLPEFGEQRADLDLAAVLAAGSGKLEFERISLRTPRSTFAFHGAIGPVPAASQGAASPAYRWEFNSDGSVVAVSGVSEPALPFLARVAGTYDPAARLLSAAEIGVRTRPGEVYGQATVQFFDGISPSVALALDIPSMPVAHAKQLWPTPTAPGARAWVMANVFGGTIENSRVRFRVGPGRLGNGVELNGDEVNGSFTIADTRFDITGELPAVRDADGTVDFRGSDVDITLLKGTVFMPTGRTLAASNGSVLIRKVESRPTTGFVDIDVEGDAQAAAEFASYRPIDAMRRLGLAAEDFTGRVKGNVKVEIPLRKDFPVEELDWEVDLAYENLDIAKPFDGQQVTQANGTIDVDPQRAVIRAKALLNGVPAEIAMTEPLGPSGAERSRDVSLVLDDAARRRLAPGLNEMLSGPVTAKVTILAPQEQRFDIDLAKARLTFPWIGWTKGAGIPATARFVMKQDGDRMRLSDFELTGETFLAKGTIVLAGGALSEADFPTVSLNRGDEIAVKLVRSGKGYDVGINGASLDARAVIKLYLSETEKAEEAVESVPITLGVAVGRTVGFNNEVMTGLNVSLRGTGTDLGALRIAALSSRGAPVSIVNEADANGRNVSIRSSDAGAVLRFLNIYEYMHGGTIDLALAAKPSGPLRGQIEARDFQVINDPKLRSLVSAPPPDGDGRSLSQVARRELDDRKARFQRGYALVEKGDGYLSIDRGLLRGAEIGATFQGALYDQRGNMDITGTFMPAYGVNRLFGEIPLFGQILGNGRDRGLIGITFRLAGDSKSPQLQVNPISAIAPGIFRSIFEFD
ncbi:DUF3971 domain-containing protein [Aquibium microcysteis]|uniref:YhdP family protein n=1 Tax=Aquibium microcysteis TaxID=675281 RepID=UPI00165D1AEA|nr:DUF3971 domain-containing protein [Aquibium microcysteis]